MQCVCKGWIALLGYELTRAERRAEGVGVTHGYNKFGARAQLRIEDGAGRVLGQ